MKERRTEHLHTLVTPRERELIEDWRFANRFETRAAAVRHLVQTGLKFDAAQKRIDDAGAKMVATMSSTKRKVEQAFAKGQSLDSRSKLFLDAYVSLVREINRMTEALASAQMERGYFVAERAAINEAVASADEMSKLFRDPP